MFCFLHEGNSDQHLQRCSVWSGHCKTVECQAPVIEVVNVVELENAPFKNALCARSWAIAHGVVGLMSNVDTNGKGDISISVGSIRKMVSGSALEKSVTHEIHYAALVRLRDIIRESFVAEIHPDYTKVNGDGVSADAHASAGK